MDCQRELDLSYTALVSGEITRKTYFTQINALASNHPEIARRFAYRKDQRSLGHFACMLYDNTLREKFLLDQAWPQIAREGDSYQDLGVSNDGRLIYATHGENRRLDFLVVNPLLGDYPLEVKCAPSDRFLTYKISDLTNYLTTPCSNLLTVVANGMIGSNGNPDRDVEFVLPKHSWFCVMDHDAVERLIKFGEHGNHPGFGGKSTVRLYGGRFSKVFEVQAFGEVQCLT